MPDDNTTMPTPTDAVGAPVLPTVSTNGATDNGGAVNPSPVVMPDLVAEDKDVAINVPKQNEDSVPALDNDNSKVSAEVVHKIGEAHNVLVALSADPSVDEMAAAIGLTIYLDKLGKRTTAIYSGTTPNALEFLKPEETFEPTVDTLQDFVIALNKEKADHLRYKLDGDFVKIYVTPYRSKISEEDLDFSYGDFNVDLVLALDVANGVDLDKALREHGRIMHDAVIINITTGNPGKLGEIEWSDKTASSVSEMIAKMLYSINSETKIEDQEATAFLTGIVAATDRFSNANTTPETMNVASKLMKSGANQQLVSKNITSDIENEMFNMSNMEGEKKEENGDPTKLDIEHSDTKKEESEEEKTEEKADVKLEEPVNGVETEKNETGEAKIEEPKAEEIKPEEVKTEEPKVEEPEAEETNSALLDDLKAAEASLATAGAEATPEEKNEPMKIDSEIGSEELPKVEEEIRQEAEKVIQPSADMAGMSNLTTGTDENKYGQMLEEALANVNDNPAVTNAPTVAANPEINGVPEINYMPMPGDEVLPPPPTPPIDMGAETPMNEPAPAPQSVNPSPNDALPTVEQPAMQDQVYAPQAADPNAFKIPGM